MFTPRSECDCFIRVTDVYRETLAEFRAAWREINGEWNADEQVWVVAFEYAGDTDPEESSQ